MSGCNDCRNTVAGCPAHRVEAPAPKAKPKRKPKKALASEVIKELLERDAPEDGDVMAELAALGQEQRDGNDGDPG